MIPPRGWCWFSGAGPGGGCEGDPAGTADTAGDAVPAGGVAEFVAARPIPSELPFSTRFDQGFGTAVYDQGIVAKRGAWGNVGKVDVLPTWRDLAVSGGSRYRADLTTTAAFSGGSSLRVGVEGEPKGYSLRPLFRTAFEDVSTVTSTVKEDGLAAATVLVAARADGRGTRQVLVLLPPGKDRSPTDVRFHVSGQVSVVHLQPTATRNLNGWSRHTYDVSAYLDRRTVAAVGLLVYPSPGAEAGASVLLGGLDLR